MTVECFHRVTEPELLRTAGNPGNRAACGLSSSGAMARFNQSPAVRGLTLLHSGQAF
jgi:hypothetical protein